jgi:hypothetical protein
MVKTRTEIVVDVKPTEIVSASLNAPFDEGKRDLEGRGYDIISLEENAKLRMQVGKDSVISKTGNWVREAFLYIPERGVYLTKYSAIMENPEEATTYSKNGSEFYMSTEQIAKSLSNSVKLTNETIPITDTINQLIPTKGLTGRIPTRGLVDNKIAVYAFGGIKNTRDYGEFLRDAGINEMAIWFADTWGKSFVRQMWFGPLSEGAELLAYKGGLGANNRVRGILKV